MTHDSTNSNFSLEPNCDEFDPLEDSNDDEQDSEYLAAISPAEKTADLAQDSAPLPTDDRTPEERTADLLSSMAPRRKVLLGVMKTCLEPQSVATVNKHIDQLQENNYSVYSAADLCALLEKAGAIKRITANGDPASKIEAEPQVVVVNGVEYLEACEPVETYWVSTDAARAALEADKPLDRLRNLLDGDTAYAVIYKRILTLCSAEGGAAMPAINNAVDNDPLVQKPRLYAPHFVDKLEKCDALTWQKAWSITDIGRTGLDLLAGITDETAPANTASKEN